MREDSPQTTLRTAAITVKLAVTGSVLLATQSLTATAQESARTAIEEVIVTAQNREQNIVDVPLAIEAYDNKFVEQTNLDDIKDLTTYSPGFTGNSKDSFIDTIAVRGIVSNASGIGGDSSLGIFKNGVHQGRTGTAVTTFFDIERAEVIRGPQGFLFGRNAISGAVNIITRRPYQDSVGGSVSVGYAENNRRETNAAFNLPLGNGWAMRAAGYYLDSDGYVDNRFTATTDDELIGQEKATGRVSLSYEGDRLSTLFMAEYEDRKQNGTLYVASPKDVDWFEGYEAILGYPIPYRGGDGAIDSDFLNPRDDGEIFNLSAQIDYDLSFATLTSITAYRTHEYYYSEDYDKVPVPIGNYFQDQEGDYYSQEFRLVSNGNGPLSWTAGISFYKEDIEADYANEIGEYEACRIYGYANCEAFTQDFWGRPYVPSADGMLREPFLAESNNDGYSAFGELVYAFSDRFEAGLGLRYSKDNKDFFLDIPRTSSSLGDVWNLGFYTDGPINQDDSWSNTSGRVFARYALNDNWNLYGSVTEGYKAGGFSNASVVATDEAIPFAGAVPDSAELDAYDPEEILSYELGLKGYLPNNRGTFDFTLFEYDYTDLQTVVFSPFVQIVNVGEVDGRGAEASLQWTVTPYLDVYANAAYTKTEQSDLRGCSSDCGGLRHPVWSSAGMITLHKRLWQGEISLVGEWSYTGERDREFDDPGITTQEAFTVAAFRLIYDSDAAWSAMLYVENAFDEFFYDNSLTNTGISPAGYFGPGRPRTVGVRLSMDFGEG